MSETNFKIWKMPLCLKKTPTVGFYLAAFFVVFLISGVSFAQTKVEPKIYTPPPAPVAKPAPQATPTRVWTPRPARRANNESDAPAEKSLATDEKVNIQLCVSEGSVKINGWDRNEIRAYVDGGSSLGFKVLQMRNQNPVWVKVLGFDPQKNREPGLDECLSGDEIELDVPRGATIDFTGQETAVKIQSVNKVTVKNVGGNILLNDIARGISAKTYEGTVTVENSGGSINLNSTTGNIVAFDTQPGEIGDSFIAKTSSGVITLQKVGHRQIEAGSNSGSIKFNGEFSSGGQYSFGTTNGAINLLIPADSSCKIKASYGGVFQSEIPLKEVSKTSSQVQSLTATLGDGDANLVLTTLGGAIRIKKK